MNQIKSPIRLESQIEELESLILTLKGATSLHAKLDFLNALPIVQDYLSEPSFIKTFLADLNPECAYVIKSLIAIGQAPIVLNMKQAGEDKGERLRLLIQQLLDLEHFYADLGGIIGYHLTILTLIVNKEIPSSHLTKSKYIHPEGFQLSQDTATTRQAIRYALENLEQLAEIYPVGGAGDRLNLIDDLSGLALPAAMLPFLNRSLLEGLIRDVQAREYLHFKLYGKQILTPIAMMTSVEKNNHSHILNIFKNHNWFGRPPESFFFFIQPLVPVLTIEGNWSLSAPLTLNLKPGGHGVIWKLAEDSGMFSWLISEGRSNSLIRQINNPLAGIDHTLLVLAGLGLKNHKSLGFSSCERFLNSAEGVNVLIETETSEGFSYCLTNVEYTDFIQKGIEEQPVKPGSPFSTYPSNTNILFIHIESIRQAMQKCLIPGQLINMKNQVPYLDLSGHLSYVQGGRLESTMQNIADYLITECPHRLNQAKFQDSLQTFIMYNERIKTISATKNSYKKGESPLSTPEQAYYDLLYNHMNLLKQNCQFKVAELGTIEEYLDRGPGCIFLYHPALGPLYSIISQKLRNGYLGTHAELQIEIAEVDIEHIEIEGSLLIESTSPIGCQDEKELLQYGHESRCYLRHVKIQNAGIDQNAKNCFWKNQIFHRESLYILLHESAEFYAENIFFEGDLFFEVPAYHRLIITQNKEGKLIKNLQKIYQPSWYWKYTFDAEDRIKLKKIINK